MTSKLRHLRWLGLSMVLVVALVALAACGNDDGEKRTIVFGDYNWNSAQAQNAIARFIVENGYGYPTDAIAGDTISLFAGLQAGDTDVSMEIWLPNQQESWDKALKDGTVASHGNSLADNWQSMFIIPQYIADANPKLLSVDDLADHMELFVTPDSDGKARLVTCIPGWECEKINDQKVTAYGLEDVVHLASPGSGGALDASISGAFKKKEAWLGYYWGPTKISSELDMFILEEPAYSDACFADDKGCAYPTASILVATNASMLDDAPDVVEFLRNWDYSAASFIAVETYMADNEADFAEGALWYLQNNEDTWVPMVPSDVAEKIKAALAAL
jgi:glycine betaine/proline transport system substrate-binding protein